MGATFSSERKSGDPPPSITSWQMTIQEQKLEQQLKELKAKQKEQEGRQREAAGLPSDSTSTAASPPSTPTPPPPRPISPNRRHTPTADDPDGDGGIARSSLPGAQGLAQAFGVPMKTIPKALEGMKDTSVPVLVTAIASTPEEIRQLNQVKLERTRCKQAAIYTLSGHHMTIGMGLFGGFVSILTPNQWGNLARLAPYAFFGLMGGTFDRWERHRDCDIAHPLPDWYIRNAIPSSQKKEIAAKQRTELTEAIEHVQKEDEKRERAYQIHQQQQQQQRKD